MRRIGRHKGAVGPALIEVHILPGLLAQLGRPAVRLELVARRFQAFLNEGSGR